MKHVIRLSIAALVIVAGTASVTAALVRAQDDGKGGGMDMDPEMMAKMMDLATPGKEHAELMKNTGAWEQHYRMRWGPEMPWTETTGTSQARPMLDERYLLEEIGFEVMGMPMKGVHILGFDKMKGEYISFWADSMSTWWVTARGKPRADGKIEFMGTMVDIAGERPHRMVIENRPDGSVYSEMFDTIPPVGEIKVMEITSRRKS